MMKDNFSNKLIYSLLLSLLVGATPLEAANLEATKDLHEEDQIKAKEKKEDLGFSLRLQQEKKNLTEFDIKDILEGVAAFTEERRDRAVNMTLHIWKEYPEVSSCNIKNILEGIAIFEGVKEQGEALNRALFIWRTPDIIGDDVKDILKGVFAFKEEEREEALICALHLWKENPCYITSYKIKDILEEVVSAFEKMKERGKALNFALRLCRNPRIDSDNVKKALKGSSVFQEEVEEVLVFVLRLWQEDSNIMGEEVEGILLRLSTFESGESLNKMLRFLLANEELDSGCVGYIFEYFSGFSKAKLEKDLDRALVLLQGDPNLTPRGVLRIL